MPTLPVHPNLDHLRHQAKDLLRAANAGDEEALREIRLVSDRITLAAAQLAVARSYGFPSWAKLKAEVEARTLELAEHAIAFCQASVNGRMRLAARMLEATPELAEYSFATAVVLGNAGRVGEELRRDPSLATSSDPRWGWSPIHLACASRWSQLEPARAEGLLAVARQLIDAGADPTATTSGARADWSPLRCVVASANSGPNHPLAQLLLERGAIPNDHDLYLAGFAHDRRQLLPLLLAHLPNARETIEQAPAAPISKNDTESVRLLLEAGADPSRYKDDDGQPVPIVWAATRAGCSAELIDLLLARQANPDLAGPDEYTPYRLATAAGRTDLCDLLRRYGADDHLSAADRFLSACIHADRAQAQRQLEADTELVARLDDNERAALVRAAERGNIDAVALMLELGFPIETRGENGGTALHLAAYSGSADTLRLLLERGADIEARDTTWNSTPLDWAAVGSGEKPKSNPAPDWIATVRTLLDHGSSLDGITLSPDDPKQPNPEVAELLRERMDARQT